MSGYGDGDDLQRLVSARGHARARSLAVSASDALSARRCAAYSDAPSGSQAEISDSGLRWMSGTCASSAG